MPAPIDEKRKAEVIRLHGEKLSRNEIARRVGISGATVTKICEEAGLTFDRSSTKIAQEARAVDLTVERLNLAYRLNEAANGMLDMLDRPFTVFNFGGKDNTFNSAELDEPPVDAQRTIITSAAIVFDKVSRIVERESGGTEAAIGLLDHAAAALSTAADALRDEGSTDAGSE